MNIANKLKELEDKYDFFYLGFFGDYFVKDKKNGSCFYFDIYTLIPFGEFPNLNKVTGNKTTIRDILLGKTHSIDLYFGFLANEMDLSFKFSIEKAGDGEVFVASCVDYNIVSQGKIPGEAVKNLKECISQSFILYFEQFRKK